MNQTPLLLWSLEMTTEPTLVRLLPEAEKLIVNRGRKVTQKRAQLLALLLREQKPVSAYDITEKFNAGFEQTVAANSIYRILDWLSQANLVHKLVSINKYVACQHDNCLNDHSFSVFMICRNCQKSQESFASKKMIEEICVGAVQEGFSNLVPHIELSGFCADCQSRSHNQG